MDFGDSVSAVTAEEQRELGKLVTFRLDDLNKRMDAGFAAMDNRLLRMEGDFRSGIQAITHVDVHTFDKAQEAHDKEHSAMEARTKERFDAVVSQLRWGLGIEAGIILIVLGVLLRSA